MQERIELANDLIAKYKGKLREVGLWRPLLEAVDYFDHAKFYMVKGKFPEARRDVFETEVGFYAAGQTHEGQQ